VGTTRGYLTSLKFMAIGMLMLAGASFASTEEPWFSIGADGRPVYPKKHAPGLPADYGKVGRDGLVWYAGFDGALDAQYAAPDNPQTVETMQAEFGRYGSELKPPPAGPAFVDGILGKAFSATAGEGHATAVFTGMNQLTPLQRGTLVIWMKTEDASLGKPFNIFSSGAGNLRHGTWTDYEIAIQEIGDITHGHSVWFVMPLTNDIKGWNMFAYTWDEKTITCYINGIYVTQAPVDVGKRKWNYFSLGRGGGQAPRIYDEVAFYDRMLSQSEIRSQYLALLKPMFRQSVSIPKTAAPVTVNGVLDPEEWQDAASVKGFLEGSPTGDFGTGQIADPQGELMLKYDDGNLYVAFRSPWPEAILRERIATTQVSGAVKSVAARGEEVNPDREDAFEILVSNPADSGGRVCRLLVNPQNVVAGGIITSMATGGAVEKVPAWNFSGKAATRDAVEGEWILEAAIPFADLGMTPAAGVPLDFNMVRHWNLLKKGSESWQWGRRENDPSKVYGGNTLCISGETEKVPLGRLQLAGPGTPVVSIVSLGDLRRGEIDFAAEVFNPGDTAADIAFSLRTGTLESGGFAPGFLLKEEKITVAPKEKGRFAFKQQVEDYSKNMLVFQASGPGGATLMKNSWQFIREEKLDIYLKKFPSAGKLAALINCGLLSGYEPSQIRARLELKDSQGRVQCSTVSPPFAGYTDTVALDVSRLSPGDYTLAVEILANDEVVAKEEKGYSHKPLPEWLGNEYGWNFDRVPAPFTPVERKGNVLSAWDRDYDFGTGLFPRQITTQGWNLLRAPVRLVVTLGDGTVIESDRIESEFAWNDRPMVTVARQVDGKLQNIEKAVGKDLRREGRAAAAANGIKITNDFWFEYDGLLWNTVRIESDRDVVVKEMMIEVPMTPFFSKDIYPGGAIPKDGFTRAVQWIGNGYGGLEPIVRAAPAGEIRAGIEPSDEGATYRLTMVNAGTPVSKLQPLVFSLQATPVKDRPAEYRRHYWYMEGSKSYFSIGPFYPDNEMFVPAPDSTFQQMTYSWDEKLSGRFPPPRNSGWSLLEKYNPRPTLYLGPYFISALNARVPEAADFKDEWLDSPNGDERVAPGDTIISPAFVVLSVRDYFLWRYARLMEKFPFGGMYYDGTVRGGYAHPLVQDVPGTKKDPALAQRELLQRFYHLVKIPFPDGCIVDHSGGGIVDMAHKSFTDFSIDGEQDWPLHYEGMANFKGVMPLAKFRTKFMGLNYGLAGFWYLKLGTKTPTLGRRGQRQSGNARSLAEHAQSIKMLHDSSQFYERYMTTGEYNNRLKNALLKHGWGSDYLMIPYWDQEIAPLPENLYASFYVKPAKDSPRPKTFDTAGYYLRTMGNSSAEKVICIFSNESDWEGEMRVKPDWKKLGFASPEGLAVENAVHRVRVKYLNPEARNSDDVDLPEGWFEYEEDPGEYARIENGELVFPMTKWNYRMIVLERKDAPR